MENSKSTDSKIEVFKYDFNEKNDDVDEYDEYEKTLEKDIETNCDLNVYVNKLEIVEKSDAELLSMEKHEIIDFKNYQIQKLRAYIISLEKEKEDLIENFRNTTNVLIEKLKENEFRESGIRPETPFITKKLKTNSLNNINSVSTTGNSMNTMNMTKTGTKSHNYLKEEVETMNRLLEENDQDSKVNFEDKVKRCPRCTKEFPSDIFIQHTLDCMRKTIKCKTCGEIIDLNNKKQHILQYRQKEHVAISEEHADIAKLLIELGADLKIRNSSDMSVLMLACQKDMLEVVKCLVENNADVNEKATITGMTPFTLCRKENEDLLLLLLKYKVKNEKRALSAIKK